MAFIYSELKEFSLHKGLNPKWHNPIFFLVGCLLNERRQKEEKDDTLLIEEELGKEDSGFKGYFQCRISRICYVQD